MGKILLKQMDDKLLKKNYFFCHSIVLCKNVLQYVHFRAKYLEEGQLSCQTLPIPLSPKFMDYVRVKNMPVGNT